MPFFSWLIYPYLIATLFHATLVLASGPCQRDQGSLLLQMKNSLDFVTDRSTKLVYWNNSKDCCSWQGVSCTGGRVTGLDLSNEGITSGINGSSSLFQLQYLQSLNLGFSDMYNTSMPPELRKLANLIYLNLSNAGFAGQIPGTISSLRKLVVLDLSTVDFLGADFPLKLEIPNLRMFLQIFSALTEMYLDGVGISAPGKEWCQALSSSLPKLRVLSLSGCNVSGPIDSSILKLTHLSVLHLDNNNFSRADPLLLANFSSLTSLSLAASSLSGEIPGGIFQLPMLQTLNLSSNELLHVSLPNFPMNGSLQTLILSSTNISGRIPDSIGNLTMLSRIEISNCSLRGQIPSSITRLKELVHLDLSSNELIGAIPSSLLSLPSLRDIQLSNNQLTGELEFSNASSSPLETLDLSNNKLGGLIPMSIFELCSLRILSLSYNNFSGQLHLGLAHQLKNLSILDLSDNRLSVNATIPESSLLSLTQLKLVSCKLMALPEFLRGQSSLWYLDLSNNQIGGQIPSWLWSLENLEYVNLSCNCLVSIQESQGKTHSFPYVIIDVHKNHLQGKIPNIGSSAMYVDFSDNNFSSVIPENIREIVGMANYFSVSGNNLTGSIPTSICNATYLNVLDLSDNFLSGTIPPCIVTSMTESEFGNANPFEVVNLSQNRLSGTIPDEFPKNCNLQTLRLSGNSLQGKVPTSLANCRSLELLDLRNNHFNDRFPCHLKSIASLRVLVLQSNHFSGTIDCQQANGTWPMLQILDIASNNFRGNLPGNTFKGWQAMKVHEDNKPVSPEVMQLQLPITGWYYKNAITIISKGAERELVKILTIFTSIDLSSNGFTGPIPEAIGELNVLHLLNLWHNALTGSIPPLLGNARQLESLDLSCNQLKGEIPARLADLNFLSVLNLSNNNLQGMIPKSTQLQ